MAAIIDDYAGHNDSLLTASARFETITPHDTNLLSRRYKAILVGGTGGAVVCIDDAGHTVTLLGIAGRILEGVRPTIIKATGTAATPLIGLY